MHIPPTIANTLPRREGRIQLKGKHPNSSTRAKRIMPSFFSDQKMKLSPINFFENTRPIPANENLEWLLQFHGLGR
jgi:hypothetical protein